MTKKAIEVLSKEENGFFLFVEGGLIDHAHHRNKARLSLDETVELSEAVRQAMDMTSEDETLIVVTSDHSHVMTMSGYPERGHDILGLSGMMGSDNLPYTTLGYANGPGAKARPDSNCTSRDLSALDLSEYNRMTRLGLAYDYRYKPSLCNTTDIITSRTAIRF